MFIAALFTIASTWKKPRCLLMDEWIKRLWYTYAVKYYPAIKRKKSESVIVSWMKLEPVKHSKVNQKEKNKHCVLIHTESRKMVLMNLFSGQE